MRPKGLSSTFCGMFFLLSHHFLNMHVDLSGYTESRECCLPTLRQAWSCVQYVHMPKEVLDPPGAVTTGCELLDSKQRVLGNWELNSVH